MPTTPSSSSSGMTFFSTERQQRAFGMLVLVLLLCASGWFLARTRNLLAEHDEIGRPTSIRDTISIDGEGKAVGKPTLARVDLGLYTEGTDVPSIQSENTRKMNTITEAMKTLGVSVDDMQTNNYVITTRYDYSQNGKQRVIGYAVSQNMNLKVRDLSKVGSVLAQAGELGANQVNGVQFTIDDPSQLEQEARRKALENARAKAKELADAMGVRLVRVVTFSEAAASPMPMVMNYRKDADSAAQPPEIQPGSLDVSSRISVTFEIK